jgi:hypothetical protein
MTIVHRTSALTGAKHTRDIPVSEGRLIDWGIRRRRGEAGLIQDEFPDLSRDDREFLLNGTVPEEWAAFEERFPE